MNMTQDKCEYAVKVLQDRGFDASHLQGEPGDHGVWLDSVWNSELEEAFSFRLHDEEIEFLQSLTT